MADDEDRNRPMLTRRTNGAGLGPAGASFDPFDSNHPSFKKKSVCEEEKEGNKGEMKVRPRREIRKQDPCENKEWKKQQRPHYC